MSTTNQPDNNEEWPRRNGYLTATYFDPINDVKPEPEPQKPISVWTI